jgi:hypothetical protein
MLLIRLGPEGEPRHAGADTLLLLKQGIKRARRKWH